MQKEKLKLIMLVLSSFVILSTLGAVWYVGFHGLTGYSVSSTPDIVFTTDMNTSSVDVTNQSAEKNETITISNQDGQQNFLLNITSNITDIEDSCEIEEGDYNVTFTYRGSPYIDGQEVSIISGDSIAIVNTKVKRLSCPAEYKSDILLEAVV